MHSICVCFFIQLKRKQKKNENIWNLFGLEATQFSQWIIFCIPFILRNIYKCDLLLWPWIYIKTLFFLDANEFLIDEMKFEWVVVQCMCVEYGAWNCVILIKENEFDSAKKQLTRTISTSSISIFFSLHPSKLDDSKIVQNLLKARRI